AAEGPTWLVNTRGSLRPLHVPGFGDWVAGQQQGANGGGDLWCGAGPGQGERGLPGEFGELGDMRREVLWQGRGHDDEVRVPGVDCSGQFLDRGAHPEVVDGAPVAVEQYGEG